MPYCPECGAESEANQTYCRECGARLYEPGETVDQASDKTTILSAEDDEADDRVKTGQEFEDEGLLSFSLTYPSRGGYMPILIGGGLGLIYMSFLLFLYLAALFLLLPFSLVGLAVWESGGSDPALTATLIVVLIVGYVVFYLVSLIPLYPIAGYYVKLTQYAAKGEIEPPAFDDWKELFVLGIKAMVLIVLPLSVLTTLVQYGPVIALEFYASEYLQAIGSLVAYIVSILVWLFLAPPLLVNYSVNQDLREAYSLNGFTSFILNTSYPVHYLLSVVLLGGLVILDLVIGFASFFTIILWIIIIPALIFYTYAVMAAFWGRVYYKTVGAGA